VRALLSVSDKNGIVDFAQGLAALGCELVSTGGTYAALSNAGLNVIPVSDVTGSPEMLDGRVKTLHPRIHGGLLARRDLDEHMHQLDEHGITAIDILVVNLYPFEAALRTERLGENDLVEQIDIGGPAMIRAAAKNFASVVVVTNPGDYGVVLQALQDGAVSHDVRRSLAARAFGHVSTYDSLIAGYLRSSDAGATFPEELSFGLRKVSGLRYGENPQQEAASYRRLDAPASGLLDAVQLHGKELSFNNLLDADAAWNALRVSERPTVSIIKHTIPCGLATRSTLAEAYEAALDGDPVSAFGGIVGCNQPVDAEAASLMTSTFFEVIIAPSFSEDAKAILMKKKNLRLIELDAPSFGQSAFLDVRPIAGGMLVQTSDTGVDDPTTWSVVTERKPSESEMNDLSYAWNAVRLLKSNAIAITRDEAVAGVGAGQPNRLESVEIAARKAGEKAQGAALASDAFFPFADGVERAIAAGITAIVQPGGSVRDDDVIAAADAAGIAMVFTGTRHFRH
jgi:phosphoribosylaminoimidazolecarboxamide formyltransferase/IMP cyclohydrolase